MRCLVFSMSVVLAACSPARVDRQLELRVAPAPVVNVLKGSIAVSAIATDEYGNIGAGTVTFSSDVGEVSSDSVALDTFGQADVTYECLSGKQEGCDTSTSALLTARWNVTPLVTATRRVTLTQPRPPPGVGEAGSSCASQAECLADLACFEGTCVGVGALRFSLSWVPQTDFDLHVITPSMKELFWANRSGDNGLLDVDSCVIPTQCRPVNVENVFWRTTPAPGRYRFFVVNFNGRAGGAFRIQVAGAGVAPQEFTGTLPATAQAKSMEFSITR